MRARVLLLAAAILAAAAWIVIARPHPAKLAFPAGQASAGAASLAPDFTLKQLNGAPLRLSDFKGKVILLDFWATWCSPCRDEIPHLVEWQAKYGGQGLQVIGVSMDDDAGPVEKFTRELILNYPVALGNQEVASQYGGILGLPVNVVIGRDGKIVSKHLGMEDLSLLERELTAQLARK
jgi:cytochrome c biogenesis protein CcmG, thiol:disulfide interchange protein DsbE